MNGQIRLALWLKRVLNMVIALMLLMAAIAAVLSIAALVGGAGGHSRTVSYPLMIPAEFTLNPETITVTSVELSDTTIVVPRTRGTLVAAGARPLHLLVFSLGLLAISAGLVWQLQLFRRILLSVIRGEPFDPKNAGRIRWIGIIVIGWSVLGPAGMYLWGRMTLPLIHAQGASLSPSYNLDFDQLWIGLGVIVLAEVFRQGSRLEEDRSLTI